MLICSLILLAGYLVWLLGEAYINRRARRSFRHVIHVNGIRGKTTTCRLIDACLRQAGFRVFTKTTGTDPIYIDTAGVEHPIRRRGPPAHRRTALYHPQGLERGRGDSRSGVHGGLA